MKRDADQMVIAALGLTKITEDYRIQMEHVQIKQDNSLWKINLKADIIASEKVFSTLSLYQRYLKFLPVSGQTVSNAMYPIYGAKDSYFQADADSKIYNYLCYYPPEKRLVVLTDFDGEFPMT